MSDQPSINSKTPAPQSDPLPPVNWERIGQTAPARMLIDERQPDDRLPLADVVVITWTTAEWSALDQVFLGNSTPRSADDKEWKEAWHPYSRGSAAFQADLKSGPLWGMFQLVRIADRSGRPWRVLLFKSNSHLAHPPWIDGLSAMLRSIVEDTKPDRIYSIGTAGGARPGGCLGDAVITNTALLDLQRPQNTTDLNNGAMFRCRTWFPTQALIEDVQRSLLYKMNQIVTRDSLGNLFAELQAKHVDDPSLAGFTLDDLLNDPIRPEKLSTPRVWEMKDVPLLTTDFYYIADGPRADAYSFLEMDDAVIALEAERAGVRYAFVRNISDPVVGSRTPQGKLIPEAIRSDWSGLIYNRFGFQTSYNGALATWATVAGEGAGGYNPPRTTNIPADDDPLEVKLAYQVRSCGTCSFFWPNNKREQPYGPYTAVDFDMNVPYPAAHPLGTAPSNWVLGRTRPPAFPEPEVVDGCRKAPIMTIGINPNLTAFAPGQTGAAWCYPNFTSDDDTDAWTKYAWYYRYRSVFQERLSLDFVRRFVLPEGQILATRAGRVVSAPRTDDSPAWNINVRYDGDAADTTLQIPGRLGDFPYVLLLDPFEPNNIFRAGDLIAGRLAVPGGIQVDIQQQQQGYYMQFVPVLQQFQETLRKSGHADATLQVGEDVCQLDMVACASPHWNPEFLGGSSDTVGRIVDNCVSRNGWAIKQLVQTRPAVLYIVSESSWKMFHAAFGAHVRRTPPLSTAPVDKDFTLLRETTAAESPCTLEFADEVDGYKYRISTRLVITPHFSYNANFLPQFRVSPTEWRTLCDSQAGFVATLTDANGFHVVPSDPTRPNEYVVIQLPGDRAKAGAALAWLQEQFPEACKMLLDSDSYYDPHAMMASVLDNLYSVGKLTWREVVGGAGYLERTLGSCQFCVNQHWQFPLGCPYGKPKEESPPPGFLEKVARRIVEEGRPSDTIGEAGLNVSS